MSQNIQLTEREASIAAESHQITIAWHRKADEIWVYNTGMFGAGFAERNATAKGFGHLVEIIRRPASANDNLYFLTGTRARWERYDSILTLLVDETNFSPEHVQSVRDSIHDFFTKQMTGASTRFRGQLKSNQVP